MRKSCAGGKEPQLKGNTEWIRVVLKSLGIVFALYLILYIRVAHVRKRVLADFLTKSKIVLY